MVNREPFRNSTLKFFKIWAIRKSVSSYISIFSFDNLEKLFTDSNLISGILQINFVVGEEIFMVKELFFTLLSEKKSNIWRANIHTNNFTIFLKSFFNEKLDLHHGYNLILILLF